MELARFTDTGYPVNLCDARTNQSRQLQCQGCKEIEELLGWLRNRKSKSPGYEGVVVSGIIHRDFTELERCATASRCVACQLIRRALLLEQITQGDVDALHKTSGQGYIFAKLHCTKKEIFLQVILGSTQPAEKSAWILCSEAQPQTRMDAFAPFSVNAMFDGLRSVVRCCHETHDTCANLAFSAANPSWLVHLLPGNRARLEAPTQDDRVHYVALSYSWGEPQDHREQLQLDETLGLAANPKDTIQQPFDRTLLPRALQDAMRVAEAFDVQYMWIDCLCIPKDADWDSEASKMHEVYGNAYFTLAAAGAERAWDSLETKREAWDFEPRGCNLDAYWLSTIDMSISDMRVRAPLSQRGWILQEERLSPRILYWCAQRAYWSCSECPAFTEGSQGFCNNRATWSRPQRFLELTYRGETEAMETEWFDIITSYVRRDLYRDSNRFLALSGLATRYLDAKSNIAKSNAREEYLAGLWRGSISHGLTWEVRKNATNNRLSHIASSWTWASLPLRTDIMFASSHETNPHFKLLNQQMLSKADDSASIVSKGANIHTLDVQGRYRRFVGPDSLKVHWSDVCVKKKGKESFDFRARPQQSVYARDPSTGRVLTYEARREKVIAQLDYSCGVEGSVLEGMERELLCLEIGKDSMLVLMQESINGELLCCTRVGVANSVRKDFFDRSEVRSIRLV